MHEVTAYSPSCCNRAMLSKASAIRHERKCLKNPINHACPTCEHLTKDYTTVYNPNHGGNPGSTDYDELQWWCESDSEEPVLISQGFVSDYKRDCPKWCPRRKEGAK